MCCCVGYVDHALTDRRWENMTPLADFSILALACSLRGWLIGVHDQTASAAPGYRRILVHKLTPEDMRGERYLESPDADIAGAAQRMARHANLWR